MSCGSMRRPAGHQVAKDRTKLPVVAGRIGGIPEARAGSHVCSWGGKEFSDLYMQRCRDIFKKAQILIFKFSLTSFDIRNILRKWFHPVK